MTTPKPAKLTGTSTPSLLYWLLVVCGLAGLSLLRLDTPEELIPIWAGSIVGVALGQLLAWIRVRAWLLAVMAMGGFWFAPIAIFVLFQSFGAEVTTCLLAFLPAAVCGYLSLSERAGLVAFWYPAVLWMLVILDGPVPGAFDKRAALPFVIGLAGLFVAFLRSRETRRVAVWCAQGSDRIAPVLPRTVLRASPLRAVSHHAWTGVVGAGALVLASWIAPHLWQKEQEKHASTVAAQHAANVVATEHPTGDDRRCCADVAAEANRVRVSEYFPLVSGQDERRRAEAAASCRVCRDDSSDSTASDYGSDTGSGTKLPALLPGDGPKGTVGDTTPTTAPTPTIEATPEPTAPSAAVTPPATKGANTGKSSTGSGKPAVIVFVSKPAPPIDTGAPWRLALTLSLGGLGLHAVVRAIRRQLTLRHLARPFWNETLDQRISNHWERMLIGLRDAGIIPKAGEQPLALAKRVGIEGMETCATILERVRHGVRVDDTDLETMSSAAGAVYRTAREKAGIAGRAAAVLRSPLA